MKLTSTNLFALRSVFGSSTTVANRIHATDRAHIVRCMKLGLVTVDGANLALTAAGIAALAAK